MDCFASSGGTLIEASKLGRKWIGVDKSDVAIETIKKNLEDKGFFANESMYEYIEI